MGQESGDGGAQDVLWRPGEDEGGEQYARRLPGLRAAQSPGQERAAVHERLGARPAHEHRSREPRGLRRAEAPSPTGGRRGRYVPDEQHAGERRQHEGRGRTGHTGPERQEHRRQEHPGRSLCYVKAAQ